jgi:hypothetical protein
MYSKLTLAYSVLEESQSKGVAAQDSALDIEIVALANRFYPSETAFPLGLFISFPISHVSSNMRTRLHRPQARIFCVGK